MSRRPTNARIHLHVLESERSIDLPYHEGPAAADDLLHTARALSSAITAIVLDDATRRDAPATCRVGCAACCRHLIPISSIEARALARLVSAMEPSARERVVRRFEGAVARLEAAGLVERGRKGRSALRSSAESSRARWLDASSRYFELGIACPFLEDERCSIHEHAPLACREYHVSTEPSRCARLDGGATELPRPIRGSEALAAAAARIFGVPETMIPLTLALDWAEVHGGALAPTHDGERMVEAFLAALDDDHDKPFDARD